MNASASIEEPAHVGVLPIVFSVTLAGIMVNSLIVPALPDIARDLHLTDLQAGLIVGGGSLPGIVFAPIAGIFADRVGRKRVLIVCLVVFGIAGGLGAFTDTFAQLFSLRIVQGMGAAGLINLSVVILGDTFKGKERARWIGINATVLTFGLFVNPLIGGLLALGGHWRRAFLPYWLALVVAAYAAARLRDSAKRTDLSVGDYLRGALRYATKRRAVGLFAAFTVIFVLIFGTVLFLFVFLLADKYGLSSGWIGLFLGGGAAVAGVFAAFAGHLHERSSPRTLVLAGFFLFALGYAVMALGSTLALMAVAVVCYAAGEGLSIPAMQNISTELAPDEFRGALVAMSVGFGRLGQTAGPIVAGAAQAGMGTAPAIAASAVLAAVCGVVLLATRVPFGGRRKEADPA